jgi:triosephosphate isomerase (TIM)
MTNKLKYFIGNWKMFGDFSSIKIIYQLNKFCISHKKMSKKNKIIICLPNTLIAYFSQKLKSKFISFGAQNCHHYSSFGSFTGSVNASMLKNVGAEYVILGHSENRFEGETNKVIKEKIINALDKNLKIILCIGETFSEKKNKKTFSVLNKQINQSILSNFNPKKIMIAYEPVWSIGSNKIPKSNELSSNINFINQQLKKIFKNRSKPKILYGGSVNSKNIKKFQLIDEIEGFLIGSASRSSKNFIDIIKNYYK